MRLQQKLSPPRHKTIATEVYPLVSHLTKLDRQINTVSSGGFSWRKLGLMETSERRKPLSRLALTEPNEFPWVSSAWFDLRCKTFSTRGSSTRTVKPPSEIEGATKTTLAVGGHGSRPGMGSGNTR